MITFIMLLGLTTLVAITFVYTIMRMSLWKNRALIVIVISAIYFFIVFMFFSYYEALLT